MHTANQLLMLPLSKELNKWPQKSGETLCVILFKNNWQCVQYGFITHLIQNEIMILISTNKSVERLVKRTKL